MLKPCPYQLQPFEVHLKLTFNVQEVVLILTLQPNPPHLKPCFIPTLFNCWRRMHGCMCVLQNHLHPCNNALDPLIGLSF
jgi:hypothetical protein